MKDMNPFGEPLPESDVSKKESSESTPSEESQEELWREVARIVDYTPDEFASLMYRTLQGKFTITRRKP